MIELARQYGRYGYRRIAALLRQAGWQVNDKRVERLWKREGLKVPQKQPKRGRLWLNDGSCVRLRPEHPNHSGPTTSFTTGPMTAGPSGRSTWSTSTPGSAWRSGSAGSSARSTSSTCSPTCSSCAGRRPSSGPTTALNASPKPSRRWIAAVGAQTAYIEPGSPWENGYCESFNARFRDELLNGEIFYTLKEAQTVIEQWRRHYNTVRPHSALGYRPPAPEAIVPLDQRPTIH